MIVHSSVSDIDPNQWKQLVEQSSTASFFQTPECYNFYASLSFMKPFVFGVSEDNKLVGLMCGYMIADGNAVKRFFSRRAIVPGGLLLDNQISDAALQKLLKLAVQQLKRQAIYIEIRNYNDYTSFRTTIETTGFSYQPHMNFQVSTPDVETVLIGMNESKRRQLKNTQKAGAVWIQTSDVDDIKAIYACLKRLYKSKVRRPLFPLEFFEKLVQIPNGKILVVKHQGRVIGGMVCAILPGNTLYEWFVCADENVNKDTYPSVAATWAGMEYAATNNIPRFDFMGAGKPDQVYGVREFKSKFGGELVEHGRFLYICNSVLYSIGQIVVERAFFKKN